MSELVSKQQAAVALAGDTFSPARDPHVHPPHLAHHFETPAQQYNSAKIGMWVFLATELLMFGGLFCAYSVFRHNNPEVFLYAHHYLDKTLGAINTVILIASSLTMAWGVRMAQLGNRNGLVACLILTLMGGAGFMVIKTIEYHHKYEEHVWFGKGNQYSKMYDGPKIEAGHGAAPAHGEATHGEAAPAGEHGAAASTVSSAPATAESHAPIEQIGPRFIDPNAGTADAAKIIPTEIIPAGLAPAVTEEHKHQVTLQDVPAARRDRISTFFSIYFVMTGLHGLHVLIGMGLITWILVRGAKNEFGPTYFTPVDLVGLYWHLVDLIWIFLFPLLYLIH